MAHVKHVLGKHGSWEIADVVNDDEHVLFGNTLTIEFDWSVVRYDGLVLNIDEGMK